MNEEQLERYSRQMLLPQIDIPGQEKLLRSRVLIIGAGGLGSPAALYLASSGVGHIIICDHDRVDRSNLQRQIIHTTKDLGRRKADSAHDTLIALNPDITVTPWNQHMEGPDLRQHIRHADAVIDASDNFATRFAVNAACVSEHIPLVSGAVVRMEGQVTVFPNNSPESPCYRCLYEDGVHEPAGTCDQNGIFAPVAGIIGSILAAEALKLLLNIGSTLVGRLLLLDAMSMEWRTLGLRRDPHCPLHFS